MATSSTRPVVIAANWKMHKLRGEALDYVGELTAWVEDELGEGGLRARGVEAIVAPPFTALESVLDATPPVAVFAQNMHHEATGAYTGEVSPAMLRDLGVQGVVLGHSERRAYFGETDEALAEKLQSALAFGLRPMLCVGETIEHRRAGNAREVVDRQLRIALEGLDIEAASDGRLSIAYEPVWAIGTGETATPELAQEMHVAIREVLAGIVGEAGAALVPVLYGGSVKPGNAAELLAQPDIDGALVGGASLEVDDFTALLQAGLSAAGSSVGA